VAVTSRYEPIDGAAWAGLPAACGGGGRGLAKLQLGGCAGLRAKGLAAVAARCPALEELDLARTGATNDGLLPLLEACPRLRKLNVAGETRGAPRRRCHSRARPPHRLWAGNR
jgi:hypothetical protein